MRALSRQELQRQAEMIGQDAFCARPWIIAERSLDLLRPRDRLSTLEYSVRHRIIRKPDGTKTHWLPDLTPYLIPIMAAHDDPAVTEIVVPKPARCGGTVVAENHALKMLDYGPSGDVMWYLAGPQEVQSYADRVLRPMFEDHEDLASQLPREGSKGNTATLKRLGARTFELLAMSAKTTTNRQARYIVFDEPDSYSRAFRSSFLEQGRQRQRMIGTGRKLYACAHPDVGWSGGIAAAWVLSSRGIFIMRCPECDGHASPYPTRYWPEVPRFRLHYQKAPEGAEIGERLRTAERTAAMACPHCGSLLDEAQRHAMVDQGRYLHEGQAFDIKAGIIGDPQQGQTWGFWIHVLMSKQVGMPELARELEGAIEHRERTGKPTKLKEVLVRTFGEVFEGAGELLEIDARALKQRTRDLAGGEEPVRYRMGEVPRGVLFVTAAVDVGGDRFDVALRGFDLQRRSWLIDRFTIRQRMHSDGVMRDIAPGKVQEDWTVLESQVIDRLLPLQGYPDMALPVAVTAIDASDGNVTWKAYEFARRMDRKRWGTWRKVRCIKGATTAKAPPLPVTPTIISRDNNGKAIEPNVTLHVLGVHQLKEGALSDLAIEEGGPGQCYFPADMPDKAFEEFFNEVLIEGKWVRNGPNETFDLYAYTEAGRLMLQPDRDALKWEPIDARPPWARPVSLQPKGGDPQDRGDGEGNAPAAAPQPKPSILDRFEGLNRG